MKRSKRHSQRVTLRDVARAARVHFSTVSRVMNPRTRDQITESVANRVLKAAERLGYRTNALAAGLRTRRSRVIGIIIPYIDSPLYPPILLAIEEILNERGYVAIISSTQNDPAREDRVLAEMMGRQVDGLILGTATRHDPIVKAWAQRGTPLVMINRTDQTGEAPSVITDDFLGLGLIVDHLVELGHKAIGHIAGPQQLSTGAARSEGFRKAMVRHGLRAKAGAITIAEDFTRECRAPRLPLAAESVYGGDRHCRRQRPARAGLLRGAAGARSVVSERCISDGLQRQHVRRFADAAFNHGTYSAAGDRNSGGAAATAEDRGAIAPP